MSRVGLRDTPVPTSVTNSAIPELPTAFYDHFFLYIGCYRRYADFKLRIYMTDSHLNCFSNKQKATQLDRGSLLVEDSCWQLDTALDKAKPGNYEMRESLLGRNRQLALFTDVYR
jgi:hypothetical protein